MNTTMKRLLDHFDRFLAGATYLERDRYLSQASDAIDLERRIRNLERQPARRVGYF
jgi:hypothetical protein